MRASGLFLAILCSLAAAASDPTNRAPKKTAPETLPGPRSDRDATVLRIQTSISGAVVYLNGRYAGRTPSGHPLVLKVPRGDYRLQIYRYGYRPMSDALNTSALGELARSYTLIPLPSEWRVRFANLSRLTNAVLSNRETSVVLGLPSMEALEDGRFRTALRAGTWDATFAAPGKILLRTNFFVAAGADLESDLKFTDARKYWTPVAEIGGPGDGDGMLRLPQTSHVFGDQLLVVDGGNDRFNWYTLDGEYVKTATLTGDQAFGFPADLAATPNPVVSDPRKNRLVFLKPDFTFDSVTSPSEPYRQPQGMDFKDGTLAVADSGSNAIRLLKGESLTATLDKLNLSSPLDVKWLRDGNLLISDYGNQRLVISSPAGELKNEVALGFNPGFLGLDAVGNIYVPDTDGRRVLTYTPSLSLSNNTFATSNASPWAVLWHAKKLYVTARDAGKILVFEER